MTVVDHGPATRRRDRIKLLLGTMVETKEKVLVLITEAKDGDDHLALGYRSWTEYVSTEYADLLADLNREDRRFAAFALSQTGMSTRAIAPILGVTQKTIVKDLQVIPEVSPAAREFFDSDEEMAEVHRIGDATVDEFEEALATARAEGDLSRENVAAKVDHLVAKTRIVTGLDGKNYTATTAISSKSKTRRRKPLPAAFHDATYDLSKVATRLENLHKDERFTDNREAVRRHRADLFRAQTILRKLIADLGDDQGVLL